MKIGGQDRPVAFTVNALLELKESYGIDILDLQNGDNRDMARVRAILFVGLKHGLRREGQKDCPFSIEDVGDWLEMNKINEIMGEFVTQAQGSDSPQEGGDGKKSPGVTSES